MPGTGSNISDEMKQAVAYVQEYAGGSKESIGKLFDLGYDTLEKFVREVEGGMRIVTIEGYKGYNLGDIISTQQSFSLEQSAMDASTKTVMSLIDEGDKIGKVEENLMYRINEYLDPRNKDSDRANAMQPQNWEHNNANRVDEEKREHDGVLPEEEKPRVIIEKANSAQVDSSTKSKGSQEH